MSFKTVYCLHSCLQGLNNCNGCIAVSLDAGASAIDALVVSIPIEGLQEAVSMASSFAVDGSADEEWQEGLQLPEVVAGSGSVRIQAGVGRMPAILSLADQIYEQNPE